MAPLQYLTRACRDAALNDANQRQLSESAAETLVSRSDSFLIALIGTGLGRKLCWNPQRADEFHGLLAASIDSLCAGQGIQGKSLSCAGIGKLLNVSIGKMKLTKSVMPENGSSKTGARKPSTRKRPERLDC